MHDADLFRYQMCSRRFADPQLTPAGETVDRLLKLDDDFGQSLQMVYFKKLLTNIALTAGEKRELHLAPEIRARAMDEMENSPAKDNLMQKRQIELRRLETELKKPVRPPGLGRYARR